MSQQKLLLFGQANLSEMDSDDKLAAPTWAQSLRAMLSRKTKQTSPAASLDPRGPSEPAEKLRRPAIIIAIAVAVVTVVALALGLGLYFGLREVSSPDTPSTSVSPETHSSSSATRETASFSSASRDTTSVPPAKTTASSTKTAPSSPT